MLGYHVPRFKGFASGWTTFGAPVMCGHALQLIDRAAVMEAAARAVRGDVYEVGRSRGDELLAAALGVRLVEDRNQEPRRVVHAAHRITCGESEGGAA